MTIQDEQAEIDRERQEEQIAEQHKIEEEARPNAQHRALVFLLKQAKMNNRDCRQEADYHIANLDREGAVPEKLAELEEPDPHVLAKTGQPATAVQQPRAPERKPAARLRTSSRFSGR